MTEQQAARPPGQPLRVVEIGEHLSGAFAGLLLAGLGHEVVQVRAGLARELNHLETTFYDRGRLVVGLPAASPSPAGLPAAASPSPAGLPAGAEVARTDLLAGTELARTDLLAGTELAWTDLLAGADVLLTDLHPARMAELGLPADEEAVAALRPGLAAVAVTSFGISGPRSAYATADITDWAAGGLSYLTRRPVDHDDIERYSPVLPAGRQPELLGGLAAAVAAQAAVRLSRRTGRSVFADVSRQEVLASMSHSYFPMMLHSMVLPGSPDARVDYGFLVPAADGEVYIRPVELSQWDRLVEWMGSPDWAVRRPDEEPLYRVARDLVGPLLAEWSSRHPKAWLLKEAARRRVPVAPSRRVTEVLSWSQLRERDAWETVVDAAGAAFTAPRLPLVGPVGPSRPVDLEELSRRWGR